MVCRREAGADSEHNAQEGRVEGLPLHRERELPWCHAEDFEQSELALPFDDREREGAGDAEQGDERQVHGRAGGGPDGTAQPRQERTGMGGDRLGQLAQVGVMGLGHDQRVARF